MNTYEDYFEFTDNLLSKQLILKTLQSYKSHIESKGYYVYAIMLKGSQNYNLADSESDIDANAILIPTPSQIRSDISPKFTFETGEVTCHNIYSFAEIVAKGNPQWIEVCHTQYHIGGSLTPFQHCVVNPSALKGMVMEKVTAFDKLYPSNKREIELYGYSPKQLHHIIRLYDVLVRNVNVYSYPDGPERDYMMSIKRGTSELTRDQAFELRDSYVAKIASIYDERKLAYKPQTVSYELLDKIVLDFYKTLP